MKKYFTLCVATLLFTSVAKTQTDQCGTMQHDAMLRETDPNYAKNREMIEKFTQRYNEKKQETGGTRAGGVITIPVVIHIVWNTDVQNISDEQALSQIDVLNEDFRRLNSDADETPGDFEGDAADFEIEFCMATVDPDGNLTSGIERQETDISVWGLDDAVKFDSEGGLDAWPNDDYLNIWCCNLDPSILGYAQFPGGAAATDGVVITYTSFGREGTVIPPYDLGRTATHEVGHWLNLYHIWGDDADCSGSDFCADTPNQLGATFGCPTHPLADDCSAAIQFQNFMDYTDDACYNMLTLDQKDRAMALFEAGGARDNIPNSTKCVFYDYDAGAVEIVSPVGTFCYDSFSPIVTISNNGLITLTSLDINYSLDGGTTSTFFWTGSLASGDEENVTLPTVTLPEGAHTLNVTVGNPNGNPDENAVNNDVYSNFVVNVTGFSLPLIQGFEDVTPFPYAGYSINNPDAALTWEKTELAAKTGASSMYINTFNITDMDEFDEISLPAYNMAGVTAAHLDFDVANAAYSLDEDFSDTLTVFVSADCGITWTSIYKKFKPELGTAPPTGANFIPTNTQWRHEEIDLTPYLADKLIIKFKSTSNWENNTYIDNINLNSGTVDVVDLNALNFTIYPVPANEFLNMQYYAAEYHEVQAEVYNMLGEKIMEEVIEGKVGNNTTTLLINELTPGYYTLKLLSGDNYAIQTFIKQ